jgi:hypothetical protein
MRTHSRTHAHAHAHTHTHTHARQGARDRLLHRRLDPVTGNMYHVIDAPPLNPSVLQRSFQRNEDTETYLDAVDTDVMTSLEAVSGAYKNVCKTVDASGSREAVFKAIEKWILTSAGEPYVL